MRKNFLFYARGFAHRYDTSNPYYHGKTNELSIKGDTTELYDKMEEVSKLLNDDEMVVVISEKNFDKCIDESYVKPALKLRDYRDEGKVIINSHLFALYMLLSAIIPVATFLTVIKMAITK